MANNITELVFILDKSGSMRGLEEDTIGGFNSMIEKQKNIDGKVYVSTVLFSNGSTVIHDRADISEISPMTGDEYWVGGNTALLDAVGGAIHHIVNVHRYARPEDVPEHTIFVITTDGKENASRLYSANDIRRMIKHEEDKYGWEFIFMAANIDAVETAEMYGMKRERAKKFNATRDGVRASFEEIDLEIASLRMK